jgi:hypothetical protein
MIRESELPALTSWQFDVLERLVRLEISVDESLRALAGVFEIEFETRLPAADGLSQRRIARSSFRLPEPGIVITRAHIANALEMKRQGQISERDLVYWATILLLNDAYVHDPGDEDMISEWLNDISINLDAS